MIKWIFFDIGSTLVDEDECHKRRFDLIEDEMIAKFGRRLSYEDEILPLAYEGAAMRTSPIGYAAKRLGITFPPYPRELEELYPDTIPALEALSKSYKLGVIANQPKGLEGILNGFGIAKYFDIIAGSDDVGIPKPDERIFSHALDMAGCAPFEALMVGDRFDNDIIPAKALGMRTARIKRGFFAKDHARDESEKPDIEIDDTSELLKLIL